MLHPPTLAPDNLPQKPLRQVSARPAGHQDYLDGIRGLAALWVVLSHLWIIPCGLAVRDDWLGLLTNWTLYSHFAVDVFIVLSGFCLILPVARDGRLAGGAVPFFRRRARRILPPFYAALVLSILAFLAGQTLNHKLLQLSLPAVLANIFLLQDILLPLNLFNGPFWSIAVEWRIYFLFPLLVWVLRRHGKRGVLTVAVLLGGALTLGLMRLHPEMRMACPWYLLLFAAGLCAGSVSVQRPCRRERLLCGAAGGTSFALLAGLVHAHPVTNRGGSDFGAWLPLLDITAGVGAAAALLILSRLPRSVPLLSGRPLVTLGTFAYSLYLVHLPCLVLGNTLLTVLQPSWHPPLLHVGVLLCLLPFVVGFARLFYLAFEKPFLRRRPISGRRQQAQQRA